MGINESLPKIERPGLDSYSKACKCGPCLQIGEQASGLTNEVNGSLSRLATIMVVVWDVTDRSILVSRSVEDYMLRERCLLSLLLIKIRTSGFVPSDTIHKATHVPRDSALPGETLEDFSMFGESDGEFDDAKFSRTP